MRDDHTPPGGASEERALRGLLHGAVEGLEPSEGSLERLRCAVPARRARKRRTLVGAAAVALLAGTAVPAAVHLTGEEASTTDRSAVAGHGRQQGAAEGAGPSDPHQNGSGVRPSAPRPGGAGPGGGGTTGLPEAAGDGPRTGGSTAGPSGTGSPAGSSLGAAGGLPGTGPQPPAAAGTPGCGADQLGVVGSARAPGADGKVYGSFKVTNVSSRGCVVSGSDSVTAAALPGAAQGVTSGVPVVGHRAGDAASGLLPDPSAEPPLLVLQPNTAYEVRFAWVPSGQTCPATPGTGPNPPQGESTGGAGRPDGVAADGAAGSNTAPGTDPQTGPPDPPGLAVSHTPAAGAPTTRTTIPEACGGTLYRTGAIPLEPAKP
ncbi:hypothetical protein [Streptomyces subrutilus]|uniref:hypothetical protein n=1 Tax=Streptomyces subrutilus TaxID=36818 RepID=UPI0033E5E8C9